MVGGRTGPFRGAAFADDALLVESNCESSLDGVILKKEVMERWAGSLAAPANWRLVRELDIGIGWVCRVVDLRRRRILRFKSRKVIRN